jgi:hypothetical protein
VQRILENGIELGFLGGFSGSVFVDHLDKGEPNKSKSHIVIKKFCLSIS